MTKQDNNKIEFHKGADYAVLMLPHQTTDSPLAHLYGRDREVTKYGQLFAAAPDLKQGMAYYMLYCLQLGAKLPDDHLAWAADVMGGEKRTGVAIAGAAINTLTQRN